MRCLRFYRVIAWLSWESWLGAGQDWGSLAARLPSCHFDSIRAETTMSFPLAAVPASPAGLIHLAWAWGCGLLLLNFCCWSQELVFTNHLASLLRCVYMSCRSMKNIWWAPENIAQKFIWPGAQGHTMYQVFPWPVFLIPPTASGSLLSSNCFQPEGLKFLRR